MRRAFVGSGVEEDLESGRGGGDIKRRVHRDCHLGYLGKSLGWF
jgi:hypothetical protein